MIGLPMSVSPLSILGFPFLPAQLVNPPVMQKTWVRSVSWEDPLEKGRATHSSILGWRIPWTLHGVTKSQTRLSDFHFHHLGSNSLAATSSTTTTSLSPFRNKNGASSPIVLFVTLQFPFQWSQSNKGKCYPQV